jgi:hypothetical protein
VYRTRFYTLGAWSVIGVALWGLAVGLVKLIMWGYSLSAPLGQ